MAKLSLNGEITRVLDMERDSIVEFKIPIWLSKHVHELDKDKKYNISITEVKSRRTLEQNNIAWQVMRDISRKMDLQPDVEDVYKQILNHANIKSEFVMTVPDAVPTLKNVFRVVIDHGSRDVKDNKGNNLHTYECLVGMSKFNRKEMSRFIESILYFAEQYGVDTSMYE